jgi:hypothetical protein
VANGQDFTAAAVVALTAAWIARAVRLDWLRVSTDLAGAATALPSWCAIHKRFDPLQAEKSACNETPSAGALAMCWLMTRSRPRFRALLGPLGLLTTVVEAVACWLLARCT